MSNATERKIIRWFHILASIPLMGYLYGPVAEKPEAAFVVRFVLFPLVVLSGFWMWKGNWLKNQVRKATRTKSAAH